MFTRGAELAVVKINLNPNFFLFVYTVLQVSCKGGLEAEASHEHPLMEQAVVGAGKGCIICTETWELST